MTTFVLAVDHRVSLRAWLAGLGLGGAEIDPAARRLKTLCVRALAQARAGLTADDVPMLLLDEEYGTDAIPAARAADLAFVIPAERSGQMEFSFEHGDRFREAVETVDPSAVKALVRYNPDGDAEAHRRSRARLGELQAYLDSADRRFMLELLVPATDAQANRYGDRFDTEARPQLTVTAIEQLAADGLRPDWWKLEGNREPAAAALVASAAAPTSRRGCLVLGRGQDRDRVVRWLVTAAAHPGYDGFAVGRTLWTGAYAALVAGDSDEQGVVAQIAAAYLDTVAAYRGAEPHPGGRGHEDMRTTAYTSTQVKGQTDES